MSGLSRTYEKCRECKFKENCNYKLLESLTYINIPKLSQNSIKIPKLSQQHIQIIQGAMLFRQYNEKEYVIPVELKFNIDNILDSVRYSVENKLIGGIGL